MSSRESIANTKDTEGELYFKHIHSLKSNCKGNHTMHVLFQSFMEQMKIIKNRIQYKIICIEFGIIMDILVPFSSVRIKFT